MAWLWPGFGLALAWLWPGFGLSQINNKNKIRPG